MPRFELPSIPEDATLEEVAAALRRLVDLLHPLLMSQGLDSQNLKTGGLSLLPRGGVAGNLDMRYLKDIDTPVVADTEFTVAHGLKRVPGYYLVVRNQNGGVVYDAHPTPFDGTLLHLKCTTGSNTVTLWVW